MEHGTSAPNERVLRITQLAKLSFNRPSVVLTADNFHYTKTKEPLSIANRFHTTFSMVSAVDLQRQYV